MAHQTLIPGQPEDEPGPLPAPVGLDGLTIQVPVTVESSGERYHLTLNAETALAHSLTKVARFTNLLRCVREG